MLRRVIVALAVLTALVALAPAASAASSVTARIGGLEYAASATTGRFGGAAEAPVAGAWLATVVHDPLDSGDAVPITGGSFTLRGRGHDIVGTFVRGSVAPRDDAAECGNQQFDVTGTVALQGGGRGAFRAVLTHLRVQTDSGCHVYGAVVGGSLTVPARTVAT